MLYLASSGKNETPADASASHYLFITSLRIAFKIKQRHGFVEQKGLSRYVYTDERLRPFLQQRGISYKQTTQIVRIFNPEIEEYYERLIMRGKKHALAINNVKNKLLRIIVPLVKKKLRGLL